jgi:hypothetical protein
MVNLDIAGVKTYHIVDHFRVGSFLHRSHEGAQKNAEENRSNGYEGSPSVSPNISPGKFKVCVHVRWIDGLNVSKFAHNFLF